MNTIDPDLFAKLMSLPDGDRTDLLEFLGATPVGQEQLNTLIGEIENSILDKRNARVAALN
ncbi:MAG TPA: hypothetical protein ENK34_11235 [Rhodobacteraceae bacterium]|nr:hypothetical protein [Paracoccaceae bacterium]